MAKKSGMLLVIAALLVVGLVGFLFFSPCGMTIEKFQDMPTPVGKKGMVAPMPASIPSFCSTYGYASPDNNIRLYSEKECNMLNGTWYANGECTKKEGGSFSLECHDLNNQPVKAPSAPLAPLQPPQPPQAQQAGFQAMKSSMMPPQPVAPTPASSAAALSLSPVQCSALCPVTQESCESKFSCQTKLTPIGVTPMTTTSTPASVV